jgi:hypothetical protein
VGVLLFRFLTPLGRFVSTHIRFQASSALAGALPRDVNVAAFERMAAFAVSLSSALAPWREALRLPLVSVLVLEVVLARAAGPAAVALVNDVLAL